MPTTTIDDPKPKDKFTFGLWTVGHAGRDPFGEATRPALAPAEIVDLLGEVGGVCGVNFHDNDLVPIDAGPDEAATIKADFAAALKRTKLRVCMATTNLFSDPVFKDGAFTSNDAEVRAYALAKTMAAMDLGAEFGAKIYVFWGGREGVETDAAKDPIEAEGRFRSALDFLCAYSIDKGYDYRFALEAKPNEPRGHMYFPTTHAYLALIPTLRHAEMVGVNPEVAHEHMAGLNFTHAVAAALAAGKLFHIDLNDQQFGRYDQDFRFGSADIKSAFFLVKLLEDCKWDGFRHFDSHAYRTSDRADVIEFARGSMRTYLILREKARQWNADSQIKSLLRQINRRSADLDALCDFSPSHAATLAAMTFDRARLAARPLPYERLDQRTMEILLGV
ncbi:MAG: xylose isomerase [Phycisphaeraceae bacterium]|nr:xylose isomerase [Phycisphaeraceae bacterium]MCW5762734.1 xylose isomerase [Phycisphaeraceae bacterium]